MKLIFVEGSGGIRWEAKSAFHAMKDYAPFRTPLIAYLPTSDGRTYEQKFFKTANGSGSSPAGIVSYDLWRFTVLKVEWVGLTERIYLKTVEDEFGVLPTPGHPYPPGSNTDGGEYIKHLFDGLTPNYEGQIYLLSSDLVDVSFKREDNRNGDAASWDIVGGSPTAVGHFSGLGSTGADTRILTLSDQFTFEDLVDSLSALPTTPTAGEILPSGYPTPFVAAGALNDTKSVRYVLSSLGLYYVNTDVFDPDYTDIDPGTYRTDWRIRADEECTVNITLRCRANQAVGTGKFAGGLVDYDGAIIAEKVVTVECNILDAGDYVSGWQVQIGDHPKSTWFTEAIEVAE